jgi:hypothetical protein
MLRFGGEGSLQPCTSSLTPNEQALYDNYVALAFSAVEQGQSARGLLPHGSGRSSEAYREMVAELGLAPRKS